MSDFDVCNVVIDNGSETCKAGFEGDDTFLLLSDAPNFRYHIYHTRNIVIYKFR